MLAKSAKTGFPEGFGHGAHKVNVSFGTVAVDNLRERLDNGWETLPAGGASPARVPRISGNLVARRRFAILGRILEFAGVEKGRVQFTWISAAEGERFSQLITEVTEEVRALGPNKRFVKEN